MLFSEEEVVEIGKLYGDVYQFEKNYNLTKPGETIDPLRRRSDAATILSRIRAYRELVPTKIRKNLNLGDPDFNRLENMCNVTIEAFESQQEPQAKTSSRC